MSKKIFFTVSGFSLVEVTIAALIFSLAVAGIFASLGAVQKPVALSDQSLQAVYCGQQVLETLKASVDIRDWDTGGLSIGSHTLNNLYPTYSACQNYSSITYTVSDGGNGTRKAVTRVNW